MLGITGMKFKKELKQMIGTDISFNIVETSFFGTEYVETGTFPVAHDPHGERDWFALITIKDDILIKVE